MYTAIQEVDNGYVVQYDTVDVDLLGDPYEVTKTRIFKKKEKTQLIEFLRKVIGNGVS